MHRQLRYFIYIESKIIGRGFVLLNNSDYKLSLQDKTFFNNFETPLSWIFTNCKETCPEKDTFLVEECYIGYIGLNGEIEIALTTEQIKKIASIIIPEVKKQKLAKIETKSKSVDIKSQLANIDKQASIQYASLWASFQAAQKKNDKNTMTSTTSQAQNISAQVEAQKLLIMMRTKQNER